MSQQDPAQQDLEFRRTLLRQAADAVRGWDVGQAPPTAVFRLQASATPAQPASTAPGQDVLGTPPAPGSAVELSQRYRRGDASPVEVTREALARAEATQSTINAFITLLADRALAAARASEERHRRGAPLGPLDGVPIAVKDLIHMAGVRTTSGSKVMADFVATEDAPIIQRLEAAGAIIIGKSNLHEFAYGGTGDVSAFGPARNPRNPEHMAGGSSSGSAAAVAAGICPIAIGTDTACSIRTPAAHCGIVGLKPTYGRVPAAGVIPLSWSQDHVGPLTATVADAGLTLSVLSDFAMPSLDPTAVTSVRIGICQEPFFGRLDPEVRKLVDTAIGLFEEVREVSLPHVGVGGAVQALITSAEARAFHAQWLATRPDDYHWSVRNRLESGAAVSAADYVQATRLRGLLIEEMAAALADVDVLAMPTVAVPAPAFGQREAKLDDGTVEPIGPLMLRNAAPMNVTGFPAISVPCGSTASGLPVGLQLVGMPWQEDKLLRIAAAFEARLAG